MKYTVETIKTALTSDSRIIYAYSSDFESTLVPSLLASIVTGRRLAVGVLHDWMKSYDYKPLIEILKDRIVARKGVRSTLRHILFHFARRFTCRIASACLTPTCAVAEYSQKALGSRRTYVIGRGLDEVWYDNSECDKVYDAIYVGRLLQTKRHRDSALCLEACGRTKERCFACGCGLV